MTGLRLPHRRASLLSLAVAPFVLLSLSALNACAKKQDRAPRPAATVSVVPAKRATVPYLIEANGVVTPMQTANVVSQVDGIILSVDFREGDEVRPGQSLFHIDPRPYKNAYDAAIAVLARDSASAAHQKVELERYQKLLEARVVTQQDLAAQATAASTAEATVRADQAAVETAQFNLENCVVRASIAGKTGGVLVRRGNMVRSGSGVPLVVINQVRPIYVRFAIPSSQLALVLQYGARGGLPVTAVPGGLAPASPSIDSLAAEAMGGAVQDAPAGPRPSLGQGGGSAGPGAMASAAGGENTGSGFGPPSGPMAGSGGSGGTSGRSPGGRRGGNPNGAAAGSANGNVAGNANGAPATVVQQSAIAGERMTGKLSFIDNAVDTSTATVQLKAIFDNQNGRLWAGQFAATSLHLFDEDSALVIPTQAVVTGQRGTYVYVVDQSDTARQRAVVVERTAGNISIIASGVRDGERVVTDGQARLTPDSPVRLRGPNDMGNGGGAGRSGGRRGGGRRGGNGGGRNGGSDAAGSGSANVKSQ
jgi:multidrug efflux pump subunit AcrA (membrane-fusion protein)